MLAKACLVGNPSNPSGKALPRVVGLGRNLVGAAGLKMHGACLSHTHDACMVCVSLKLTMVCVTLIHTMVCVSYTLSLDEGWAEPHALSRISQTRARVHA
jgi:hypothetical protein